MTPFSDEERATLLAALPRWSFDPDRDAIVRSARFADQSAARAFVARLARLAQALKHHPECSNTDACVRILLTTHDAGGLTHRDATMAHAIEALLSG